MKHSAAQLGYLPDLACSAYLELLMCYQLCHLRIEFASRLHAPFELIHIDRTCIDARLPLLAILLCRCKCASSNKNFTVRGLFRESSNLYNLYEYLKAVREKERNLHQNLIFRIVYLQ